MLPYVNHMHKSIKQKAQRHTTEKFVIKNYTLLLILLRTGKFSLRATKQININAIVDASGSIRSE